MTTTKPITTEDIRKIFEASIAPLAKDLAAHSERIEKGYNILTGNGNPASGLVYIVQVMGDKIHAIEDARTSERMELNERRKSIELKAWQIFLMLLSPLITMAFGWFIAGK